MRVPAVSESKNFVETSDSVQQLSVAKVPNTMTSVDAFPRVECKAVHECFAACSSFDSGRQTIALPTFIQIL